MEINAVFEIVLLNLHFWDDQLEHSTTSTYQTKLLYFTGKNEMNGTILLCQFWRRTVYRTDLEWVLNHEKNW